MNNKTKISPFSNDISKYLLDIKSIQFNIKSPFTWVSGIKSPIYCDNRKINSYVEIRRKIVLAFVDLIQREFTDTEIIAGVATGGIPLGVLVAEKMNLPFIYVRQEPKKHGLLRQVEGVYKKGDNVVLIEDHISTGGSSLKAIDGLKQEGLNLLGLISIMTYGFDKSIDLFEKNNVNHYSLCDLKSILDTALNLGTISKAENDIITKFREDPDNWYNRINQDNP